MAALNCVFCQTSMSELLASEEHVKAKGRTVIHETRLRHEELDRQSAETGVNFKGYRAAADARAQLLFEMNKGLQARLGKMAERRRLLVTTGYCCHECQSRSFELPRTERVRDVDGEYTSLREFLEEAGLQDLLPRFISEKITLPRLLNLQDEFFRELGLKIGERQELQNAVARHRGLPPAPKLSPLKPVDVAAGAAFPKFPPGTPARETATVEGFDCATPSSAGLES
mmetsp:Transcript_50752/g.118966  ORF Transcript_50752/g.118966 Transcript_50752/m.118966 type:complete len:228 (+) Transcript_50752:55-738(+)